MVPTGFSDAGWKMYPEEPSELVVKTLGKTNNTADHCALQTARVETVAFYLRHELLSSELL